MLYTKSITKRYKDKTALSDVSVSVQRGQILGLLGLNGSGKSTFLKIAAGILAADQGSMTVDGGPLTAETKKVIAFLPENNQLYEWMTVGDAIQLFRIFYDDFDLERFKALSDSLKLDEKQKVTRLPKGILQQLRICLTLSRRAKLFLLDEPLNGIDILARERVVSMIRKTISPGNSVIISSHIVSEIEKLLDAVVVISDGRVLFEGECEQLRLDRRDSIESIYKEVLIREQTHKI